MDEHPDEVSKGQAHEPASEPAREPARPDFSWPAWPMRPSRESPQDSPGAPQGDPGRESGAPRPAPPQPEAAPVEQARPEQRRPEAPPPEPPQADVPDQTVPAQEPWSEPVGASWPPPGQPPSPPGGVPPFPPAGIPPYSHGGPPGPPGPAHFPPPPLGAVPPLGFWSPYPPMLHPVAPRAPKRWAFALGASALAVVALGVGVGIGYGVWNRGSGSTPSVGLGLPQTQAPGNLVPRTVGSSTGGPHRTSSAAGAPSGLSAIAAKVVPALVDVNTVLGYATEQAAGTGMVLTPTGLVLTNNHVIEGSTNLSVTDLGNQKTYHASVVGYDRTGDVAVIKLEGASGLKTVTLGRSSALKVGQPVVGIGNAGGLGGTPSTAGGSVTALNQSITASDQGGSSGATTEHLKGLVQTNCDIEPGDSGGPLVDATGHVVGMDTAASAAQGYSFSGVTSGQGYSIPIDFALTTAHQIVHGVSSATVHIGATPFLGVYVTPRVPSREGASTSPATVTGLLTPTAEPGAAPSTTAPTPPPGVAVVGVVPGAPAARAGLVKGDTITSISGAKVTASDQLTHLMMRYQPGDRVKVVWSTRTGHVASATLTLGSGPAD